MYVVTSTIVAISDLGDSAYFQQSCKVTNSAGALGAMTLFSTTTLADPALATASIAFMTSGVDLLVQVTGVAATNINWKAYRDVKFVEM